jgi:uncharacterized RDD family membrane protein YckC
MSDFEGNWAPPPGAPMEHNDIAGFWIRLLAHICDQVSSLVIIIPFAFVTLFVDGPAADVVTVAGGLAAAWLIAKWTSERGGSPLRARLGVLVIDQRDGSFLDMNRSLKRAMFPAVLAIASQFLWVFIVFALLDYLISLSSPVRQTWHDRIAGSVVVRR